MTVALGRRGLIPITVIAVLIIVIVVTRPLVQYVSSIVPLNVSRVLV